MAAPSVGSPQVEAPSGAPAGQATSGDDLVMFLGDMFDLHGGNGVAKAGDAAQPQEPCLSSDSLETLLLQQNANVGAFAEVTSYSADSRDHAPGVGGMKADVLAVDSANSPLYAASPAAVAASLHSPAALHSPASTRQHSPASASPRALSAGSPAISQDTSPNGTYASSGALSGPHQQQMATLSPQLSQQSVPGVPVVDLPPQLPHVHTVLSHSISPSPLNGTPAASPLHTPVASPTVAALGAANSPFADSGVAGMLPGGAAAGLPPGVAQQQQQQRHPDEAYLQQQHQQQRQHQQHQHQLQHQQHLQHQQQQQQQLQQQQQQLQHQQQQHHQHQQQHQQHQQQRRQQQAMMQQHAPQQVQHMQAQHTHHNDVASPGPVHHLEQAPHHLSPLQVPVGQLHISRTPSPQPLGFASHSPAPGGLSPATSLQHIPTPPASPPPPLSPIHLHQPGALQHSHSPGPAGHQVSHLPPGHHSTMQQPLHPQQGGIHQSVSPQPTSHAGYSHQPPQQLSMGQASHHHLPQQQVAAVHSQAPPQYSQATHSHQMMPHQQLAPISVAPARSPPPHMHHNPDPFRMAAQQQPITQQLSAPQQHLYISTPPATSPHAPGYAPASPPPHALQPHHSAPHPAVGTPPQYHGVPPPQSSALSTSPMPVSSLPPGHMGSSMQQQQQPGGAMYHSGVGPSSQMLQQAHSAELAQLQQMHSGQLQQMHSGQLRSHSPVPLDVHGQPLLHVVAPLSPSGAALPGSGLQSPHSVLPPGGLLASPQHSQSLGDAMDMDDTKDVMSRKEAPAVPRFEIMRAVEALRHKLHNLEMEHTQLKVQCDEMERLDVGADMAVDGCSGEAAGRDLKHLLARMEEHNLVLRAEISSLEQSIGMQ